MLNLNLIFSPWTFVKSLDPQHNRTDGHTDLHGRKNDQQRVDAFQEHLRVGHKNETYILYS